MQDTLSEVAFVALFVLFVVLLVALFVLPVVLSLALLSVLLEPQSLALPVVFACAL